MGDISSSTTTNRALIETQQRTLTELVEVNTRLEDLLLQLIAGVVLVVKNTDDDLDLETKDIVEFMDDIVDDDLGID